jgi:hypothetical protein
MYAVWWKAAGRAPPLQHLCPFVLLTIFEQRIKSKIGSYNWWY